MKVGAYLDGWLKDYAKQHAAPQTYRRYESIVRLHLKPALGNLLLSKLQPLHIQHCYTEAVENGRIGSKGPLSSTTVLQHHHVLSEALKHAFRLGLIARNPAQAVQPPRPRKSEVSYYNVEEVQTLMGLTSGSWLHVPVMLAVTTGMRRGEVLGLKWTDITLDPEREEGSLQVRRSLQEDLSTKAPKTASGSRTIPLPATMVAALKKHRAMQAAQRLALGSAYCIEDWVCAHEDGNVITPSALSHGFKSFVAKSELKQVRFHDLRHTHATLLLLNGENPKVVSERLGHSQVSITLDVYSHVMPNMQEEAAGRFDALLKPQAREAASA